MRFSVTGNVLDLKGPKSIWAEQFSSRVLVSTLISTLNFLPNYQYNTTGDQTAAGENSRQNTQ